MARNLSRFLRAAVLGAAAAALLPAALPTAAGEAPWRSIRPEPRPEAQPGPQAEWRDRRRADADARRAFERERREDRQDWLWGGSWRAWLDARRAADQARAEQRRKDRLGRQGVRPEAQVRDLGERLDDQWRRQRDRWDARRDSRFDSRFPRPRSVDRLGR